MEKETKFGWAALVGIIAITVSTLSLLLAAPDVSNTITASTVILFILGDGVLRRYTWWW
jgi:putative copper export protein